MRKQTVVKKLVSLALGLVMVMGLAVPVYADWWDDEPGIFIEDGVAVINPDGMWGHIEISNATSIGSNEWGQLVVYATAPASITAFGGSYRTHRIVLGDLGHTVQLIGEEVNWDSDSWELTMIEPILGLRESTTIGGDVDETWFTGAILYELDAGHYLLHAPAEGGIFVIISGSTDTTVTSEPTPPTTAPNLNTASTWAHEGINNAVAAGLVPQSLQNHYTNNITRAEFTALAVLLYETATGREITGRVTFNDTNDVNVEKAAYIGIVSGTGNNNFSPNMQFNREQAAVILSRLADAIGQPLPQVAAAFADNAEISSWAIESVGQVQTAGIMGGIGNNVFSPQGTFTREQSIVTILRLFDVFN